MQIIRQINNYILRQDCNRCYQVYLTVGGWGLLGPTDSTEILTTGSSAWQEISPFPFKVFGLGGVSYNNTILIFGRYIKVKGKGLFSFILLSLGGYGAGNSFNKTVYQFEPTSNTWKSFGLTKHEFADHAVDLVKYSDFSKYCK